MRPLILTLLLSLLVRPLFASAPYLVTDLKTTSDFAGSSDAIYLGALNGIVFFGARVEGQQYALWRTDGTPGGSFKLVTLAYDPIYGYPYAGLVSSGGFAYFGAHDSEGWKLWKSDGTVAGTSAVTPASPTHLAPVAVLAQGRIAVLTYPAAGRQLWVYDSNGFRSLGTTISNPQSLMVATMGGNLYIGSNAGIWKSDGTEGGTSKISSTAAFNLAATNDRLFFAGSSVEAGGELWVTDGTSAGTHLVTDLRPGTASTFVYGASAITAFGNGVAFTGANGEFGISDGTPAGTRVVRTGAKPTSFVPYAMRVLNGVLFFAFDDGAHGRELWRSDGTDAGTRMVRDHNRQAADITTMAAGATRVYYYDIADADGRDLELFESDGTEAGTHVVYRPGGTKWRGSAGTSKTLITVGDTVIFNTDDGEHGSEPWVSDGSEGGTRLLANVAVDAVGSSYPDSLIAGADRIYFKARGNETPAGVWSTDGTAAGTRQVADQESALMATNGNTLYMKRGKVSTVLPQLWKSEGGPPGTDVLVKDFDQGFNTPAVYGVYPIDGRVYVIAEDGRTTQLWITDGTTAGTKPLTRFFIDVPSAPVSAGNQTYFIASNSTVFATDGTPEGTRSVARAVDTTGPLSPLVPFGGSLLSFVEVQSAHESQLIRFSGTAGDAAIIKHLPGGSRAQVASMGSSVLFSWWADSLHPNQLWKTDGTAAGTQLVRDFDVPGIVTLEAFASLGTRVVFVVDDGVHGREPWVSDGTADGTRLLRDLTPGSGSGVFGPFFVADGIAYFAATEPVHGSELWQTDGTPEGTQLVADIEPGTKGSSPAGFARLGNTLYFRATTEATGAELWAYPLPATSAIRIEDTRVPENASTATLTIRLTQPASQQVTVEYETADDTAKSGSDYTAKSGSVVFGRGESAKSISVAIANDATPGTIRSFFVRVRNASVPVERAAGAVVIEDDDIAADVAVSLSATDYLPMLTVTNNGPSAASNVRLCMATPPQQTAFSCGEPFELAAGEKRFQQVSSSTAASIVARVSSWETDANPANNANTWLSSGFASSSMFVAPPALRVGETGSISVGQYKSNDPTDVQLTSSDPSVVRVPAAVTIAAGTTSAATTFTALKPGTATISAKTRYNTETALVRVIGAGEAVRATPATRFDTISVWTFGQPNHLRVLVNGVGYSGVQPTGTVQFFEDGKLRGSAPLVGQVAQLPLPDPLLGARTYTASYSGDATFFDAAVAPQQIFVHRGIVSIAAAAIPGTANVLISVRGVKGYVPAGTLTVTENGAPRSVSGALAKTSESSGSTTATGFSPASRTVSIVYSGDSQYEPATVTIPIGGPRQRSARH